MSAIWAVVPVKETAGAKQRLAAVLPQATRSALSLAMLEDALRALASARGLAGILVVTPDTAAQNLALRYSAQVSHDHAREGHTAAIMGAARRLAAEGAAMLTIPGDVPLATAPEIEQIIDTHRSGHDFVIVPARDERGSNAILVSPADAVPLHFGADSFSPHLAAARGCGIEPAILHLPGIGLDIDTPEDLAAFLAQPSRTRAQALLEASGVRAA